MQAAAAEVRQAAGGGAEVRQAAGGGALRAVRRTDSPKDADGGANAAGTPDSFFFGKQI